MNIQYQKDEFINKTLVGFSFLTGVYFNSASTNLSFS